MSKNLKLARTAIDAWDRRDIEGMLECCHPAVKWMEDPRVPGALTRRGHAEVKRYFESVPRYWESLRVERERFVDCGDRVLLLAQVTTRARRGGPEMERPFDVMITLREDKIVGARWFSTRQEALQAAGLPA